MKDLILKISTDSAKTIGLNETILLEAIRTLNKTEISKEELFTELQFLSKNEINKTIASLISKGLIKTQSSYDSFSLISQRDLKERQKQRSNKKIEGTWYPEEGVILQAEEYGIPLTFLESKIDEFIHLHKEKQDSSETWEIKFLRFLIKKWREQETIDYKNKKKSPITKEWYPEIDALEILLKADIPKEFVENQLPEFILYWSEKGQLTDTWNSKFIAHVRRQWAKNNSIIDSNDAPKPIENEWIPNDDFFQVLALTGISKEFAESVRADFILYWKESGQAHVSWNSKFLQHVKYCWQKQNNSPMQTSDELNKRTEESWKIDKSTDQQEDPFLHKDEIKSNLEKLRQKHKI